jgi:hypothetical protein
VVEYFPCVLLCQMAVRLNRQHAIQMPGMASKVFQAICGFNRGQGDVGPKRQGEICNPMETGGLGFFAFQIDQGVAWSWSWSLAFCVYEYVYLLSGFPAAFIWLLVVEDAPSFGEGSLFQ